MALQGVGPRSGLLGHQEEAEVKCAMVIEFLCPQGHKIRCADDRAGKPAKCPKCGVKFYVPGPDDSEPSDSGSWATAPAETSTSPGTSSTGSLKEQIEFLCPNGHRVWAPIALQGRAGQCPECGSKFHIPTLADYEEMPLDILTSDDSVVNLDPLGALHGNGGSSKSGEGLLWPGNPTQSDQLARGAHGALVRFLAELVADTTENAGIELFTTDGQKFVPDQLAESLCDSDRLAFSIKADDEKYSVIVLPWASIARIEARGLKQLPLEFRK